MAAYEVLLLNTAIPQIQAAQAGDTYVVPRDIAFSTVASLAAGTEALPSLVATGDVNTGFWFPAADTIAASTGGTRRLTLDSSGNLGIGTTSPGAKLEVAASGSSQQLRLVSTGNSILRTRWIDATAGFTLESNNTTETAYYPFTLTGSVLRFNTGAGSQAMTLDASGRLGVGVTNPGVGLVVSYGTDGIIGNYYSSGGANSRISFSNTSLLNDNVSIGSASDAMVMYTGNTERARITSGGDLLVGSPTAFISGTTRLQVYHDSHPAAEFSTGAGALTDVAGFWNKATSGDNQFAGFYTETSPSRKGSITYNRAGGLVAYNTTSDYRAKDIIGPVTDAGVTIDALKVYNGKMKGATVERPMLIAHEAQEVTPYAVTGEKDAVDEDGKPKYQQMDVSSLVPLLIAELQSLRARVAQLEAK